MPKIYRENIDKQAFENGLAWAELLLIDLKAGDFTDERIENLNEAMAIIADAVFETKTHPDPSLDPEEDDRPGC